MLPLTRSRNRSRFFGIPFSPSVLFEGGTVPGAWYDSSDPSTMFTTSAGTTPVAMPGQGSAVSVGLMLDKSQGLVLGSELVTNGDFSSAAGWTGATSISGGAANFTAVSSYFYRTDIAVSAAKWYRVTFTIINYVSGQARPYLNASPVFGTFVSGNGTYTQYLLAASGSAECGLNISSFTGSVDNISIRELPGNHAISFNNTTARPELRARVNLLTYSEDWTNAVWTGVSDRTNVTTTPNAGTNPIGGSNATRLQGTANNWFQGQTVSLTSLTPLVLSLWVKSNTGSSQTFRFFGTGGSQISSDLTATTDWQQFSFPYTPTNTAQQCGIIRNSSNSTADLLIWGADLRPANIGANVPAYQRIADANTYDTSGFPLYLLFEGIDDSMYTPANLNLSGTDKATVFAGVRKLSDSGAQVISELSSNVGSNNGSFATFANVDAAGGTTAGAYGGILKGTTAYIGADALSLNAPISNVVAQQMNIAAASDAVVFRIDGVQVDTSGGASAGSGNFGTYPLNIGVRSAASSPTLYFNGHLYSLAVVGSAVSAGNIAAMENWVAGKTGIVI